ncbi:MAG: hypothetical protein CMJ89_05660 [Planctomycetes bacterium]|nr:hypothetical protein [Planctomycetota bacterium]
MIATVWATAFLTPALPADDKSPVTSYAEIDERFEGEYLVALGAVWRYLVGVAEPEGEKGDWTKIEFWDSDWKEGPSPLGYGAEGLATTIEGMEGEATTVYLRHILDMGDPAMYEYIELRCPIDDGYVFYVNGATQDRIHSGGGIFVAHDSQATTERKIERLPVPTSEMTFDLKPGPNPLAFIGLVHKDDQQSFEIRPQIYGRFRKNPDEDNLRKRQTRKRLAGDRIEFLDAYLEGVFLQRSGRAREAIDFFAKAANGDPQASEPWQRMIECARTAGSLAQVVEGLEDRIQMGLADLSLLNAWARAVLEDLGGSAAHIRTVVQKASNLPDNGYFADALWTAELMLADEPLRIDCGAAYDHGANGTTWSRDRLFTYGEVKRRGLESWPHSALGRAEGVVRVADRKLGESQAMYHFPLTKGAYELRLSFNMDADNGLDVIVNGMRAIRALRGKNGLERISIPAHTHTNFLELDLVARTKKKASLAGVEVWPLGAECFEKLAGAWLEKSGSKDPYALVQQAEALLALDRTREALHTFEVAEAISGFTPAAGQRLQLLRENLLPHIYSYASADGFAKLLGQEASGLVKEAREVAGSDAEKAIALYLQGRIDQMAGRLDDATIAFEELAFSDSTGTEPFQRMAECLLSAALAPEAEDIVHSAIESKVEITPAFLRFWISLALNGLDRDPWDVVADLAELPLNLPEYSVVVPTSENSPQPWQYLNSQPPTVKWSQTSFGAVGWFDGAGGLGWGSSLQSNVRTPWENQVIYARTGFSLPGNRLLFPHARIALNDGGDIYLNGAISHRVNGRTKGYDTVPMRKGSFQKGENFIGIYGVNVRGEAYADCGIVEPLGLLVWVLRTLEKGPLRLNCGGVEYKDSRGNLWHGDRFFGHGVRWYSAESEQSPRIEWTEDDELYRSQRAYPTRHKKAASYQIPVPDGKYSVTMHFAESDPRFKEAEKRQFGVKLEGDVVLEKWDPLAELGFARATSQTFETEVTDDWLDIDFVHVKDRSLPSISALEIQRID